MNSCMASLLAPVAPGAPPSPACPSKSKAAAAISQRRRAVLCKATGGGRGSSDNDDGLLWLPRRRDMLSGLSGVAAGLAGYQGLASAAGPDCLLGDKVQGKLLDCTVAPSDPNSPAAFVLPCPARPQAAPVDFTPASKVSRVRQPIHLLSREKQDQYKAAVAKMKALPPENPLSFAAQAAIHQAYCDGHYRYDPAAKKGVPFDVHFSWLFAPWHRMYIYFYERALGKLIGDDTFALPFWNWDTPAGMVVPPLFRDSFANPLHNKNRDPSRVGMLAQLDLDFFADNAPPLIPFDAPQDAKYKEAVNKNLSTLYQQQIRLGTCARTFLGEKFCTKLTDKILADEDFKTGCQGSLERMAHTALHAWVGGDESSFRGSDGKDHKGADMGYLGSAGRDPLFYSHHANVDRLWHLWSTKLGGGNGFSDAEWLDASFDFYDDVDDPKLVRIKFRDVLDTRGLGYTYDEAETELPWLKNNLTRLVPKGGKAGKTTKPAAAVFPVTLRKGQVVEVPAVAVPAKQAGQERVLVIQSFEYDPCERNKFDVAINVPKEEALKVGPQHVEYAGGFAVVPCSNEGGGLFDGKLALPVDAALADVMGPGETTVDIVIVPRTDKEIKIKVAPVIENQKK